MEANGLPGWKIKLLDLSGLVGGVLPSLLHQPMKSMPAPRSHILILPQGIHSSSRFGESSSCTHVIHQGPTRMLWYQQTRHNKWQTFLFGAIDGELQGD